SSRAFSSLGRSVSTMETCSRSETGADRKESPTSSTAAEPVWTCPAIGLACLLANPAHCPGLGAADGGPNAPPGVGVMHRCRGGRELDAADGRSSPADACHRLFNSYLRYPLPDPYDKTGIADCYRGRTLGAALSSPSYSLARRVPDLALERSRELFIVDFPAGEFLVVNEDDGHAVTEFHLQLRVLVDVHPLQHGVFRR